MHVTLPRALAGGAIVSACAVAFALRPAMLSPHAAPSPSLELPHSAPAPIAARPATSVVYVAGAVLHPGVYVVAGSARAVDAVTRAGGLTPAADTLAVNLAGHVTDGEEIAVPRIGEALGAGPGSVRPATTSRHRRHGRHHRSAAVAALHEGAAEAAVPAPASGRIDLNAADAAALATVPGIGPTLADRIVAFRSLNGPFATVDGLADVSGISASRFDAIASFLTVGAP